MQEPISRRTCGALALCNIDDISHLTRIRWNNDQQSGITREQENVAANVHGFGSISRRQSDKPIIAAVIGGAYGGGMEMVLNCDLVIASEDAKFALPEVKRGVVAIQGGTSYQGRISYERD